jgi:hypothetical protein
MLVWSFQISFKNTKKCRPNFYPFYCATKTYINFEQKHILICQNAKALKKAHLVAFVKLVKKFLLFAIGQFLIYLFSVISLNGDVKRKSS